MNLHRRRQAADPSVEDLRQKVDHLSELIARYATDAAGHGAWLADLQKWMTSCVQTLSGLTDTPPIQSPELLASGPLARRVDAAEAIGQQLAIWTVSTWVDQVDVSHELKVSVITPTRNRRPRLQRAIASVQAQSYPTWEHIIVDDASDDGTPEMLGEAAARDPRIRSVCVVERTHHAARRNMALEMATGDVIAYLDDDNLMDRNWLKALAWFFSRWPTEQAVYGARIIDEVPSVQETPVIWPTIEFRPWDRRRFEHASFIDQNVMAHRSGLRQAWFDEDLPTMQDWDFWLRLTADHTPIALPVLACLYLTDAPGRMSHSDPLGTDRVIRARAHVGRPLVLLGHGWAPAEPTGQGATFLSTEGTDGDVLAEGFKDHEPDIIVVRVGPDLDRFASHLESAGRPFALVALASDRLDGTEELVAHRLCLGAWADEEAVGAPPGTRPFSTDKAFVEDLSEALRVWKLSRS